MPPETMRETVPETAVPEGAAIRTIYLACTLVAFGLFMAINAASHGVVFLVAGLAAAAAMASGLAPVLPARLGGLFRAGIALGLLLAGFDALTVSPDQPTLAEAVASRAIWPHALVGLFASRAMAEDNELRAAAFWTEPMAVARPPHAQSTLSALGLALALTLAFWWLMPRLVGGAETPAGRVVLGALRGDTLIHHAILFLFFLLAGYLIDGFWLHWQDRSAVDELRRAAPAMPKGAGDIAAGALRAATQSRLLPPAQEIAAQGGVTLPVPTLRSASALRQAQATRRFIRSLLPILPMLGFLGTVIGLSVAIADLPRGLGQEPGQPLDVAGSLSGLALKFETTLLGLAASMIAAVALAWLERAEAELQAQCAVLLGARLAGRDG